MYAFVHKRSNNLSLDYRKNQVSHLYRSNTHQHRKTEETLTYPKFNMGWDPSDREADIMSTVYDPEFHDIVFIRDLFSVCKCNSYPFIEFPENGHTGCVCGGHSVHRY